MLHKRQNLQLAYILHTRAYRETSLLVECFTHAHGRIHAVAKGAKRSHSVFKHVLQPFMPLLISWVGRHELMTLTYAEYKMVCEPISPNRLMSGFYINELLLRLLIGQDPHPKLFQYYEQTLQALRHAATVAPALRLFEKYLLQEMGYGIVWDKSAQGESIEPTHWYQVNPQQGLVALNQQQVDITDPSVVLGRSIIDLQREQWTDKASLQDAKYVLRILLKPHLGQRPLKTSQMLLTKEHALSRHV